MTLTLKNGNKDGNKDITGTTTDNVTYTFKDVGTFAAGTKQNDTLTLTFTANADAASGSWSDINITVNAVQVD